MSLKDLIMNDLRLYFDVARCRSFSQAAADHGITQSAASQRVGHLEKRLAVKLIDRSVRPLALTEAGEVFLRGCQEILGLYETVESSIARFRSPADTTIRIDAIYSAGIDLLNQVKEQFEAKHPNIRVVLEYKHPDQVHDAVRHDRCDLGIVSYPDRLRDVQVIPLRDEPMAVVCAPDHPLAGHEQVDVSTLDGLAMVAFEPSLPVSRRIRAYLREHGVKPTVASVFDNIDTIKSAVAATHGMAIVPKRTVLPEVAAGTLTAAELEPPLTRPMGVIHHCRSGKGFRPAIQAFVDLLLKQAGPQGHTAPGGSHSLTEAGAAAPQPIGKT